MARKKKVVAKKTVKKPPRKREPGKKYDQNAWVRGYFIN
jgi:hypothetical protein